MHRDQSRTQPSSMLLLFVTSAWLAAASAATADCDPATTAAGGLTLGANCASAPVLATEIAIDVTGMIARTRVTQRFRNPGDEWVDATYTFPLPDDAAVDHLTMRIGNRIVEGRIEERDAARRTFEQARQRGNRATLVEQHRANVFTTELTNIGPGDTIEVAIELQHLVRYGDGELRLRFPTVVAPRYFPGDDEPASPACSDPPFAEPWTAAPAAAEPVNPIELQLRIDPGMPLQTIYSPTHLIESRAIGGDSYEIALASPDFADRDFVLAWRPEAGEAPRFAIFQEAGDDAHYSLLMMLPPQAGASAPASRSQREIVFVIDTSGSMAGPALDDARTALLLGLDRLQPRDHFDVIEFSDRADSLFDASVAASPDAVDRARRFVDGLSANGGTNIVDALHLALSPQATPDRVRQVVFITDGAVGNEAEIFGEIADAIGASRLFTVGIGSAPNAYFLRKAAHFGRGTHTYISNIGEISGRMESLFRKLEAPVMVDIEVEWNGAAQSAARPDPIPDLYLGEPLVVVAKLTNPADAITVWGHDGLSDWTVVEVAPAAPAGTDRGIGRLWARREIGALLDDLALGADRVQVRAEVVELALEHQLVTPFTSLVAVDPMISAPPGGGTRHAVAVNRPAGSMPRTATHWQLTALAALLLIALSLSIGVTRDRALRGTAQ